MRPRTTRFADGHFERHLDGDHRPRGPRRSRKACLQLVQLLGVALGDVGIGSAGQIGEVEQSLGAVEPLDPVMKRIAKQRMRFQPDRQSTGQPLRGVLGVADEVDQAADRQPAG